MAINSLSASSKGFSGLASGIDTESVVKQMLAGTQGKIDSQNQKKTQLEYKQELYRSVISDLQKFQTSYFSYTNQSSNLLSRTFFQSKSATTSSKSYTVTATSSAASGNITVNEIKSLASNFTQTSKIAASTTISGAIDNEKLDALRTALQSDQLVFKVGDDEIKVNLDVLAGKGSLEVRAKLNEALSGKASVEYVNGAFTLTTVDPEAKFTIDGSDSALKLLGGSSLSGTGSSSFKVNTAAVLPTLSVNIDGTAKSITFNPLDTTVSIDKQLNTAIASAFGSGIKVSDEGGVLTIKAFTSSGEADLTRKITISGDEQTMGALGMKKNVSNKLALNNSLNSNYFATPVVGQRQEFTINGVDFSFSSDQSLSSIINAINSSDAGVKISYSATTDTFSLEATASGKRGADFQFAVSQSEGNLMTALFGVAPSGNTTGATLAKQLTGATIPEGDFLFKGGAVKLNVNGSDVTLNIAGTYTSPKALVNAMNTALEKQFGLGDAGANVSFVLSEDGTTVELKSSASHPAYISNNSLKALGFDATAKDGTTLAELGITENVVFNIGTQPPDLPPDTTIQEMINQINSAAGKTVASFDESKAYIRIFGVDIPMDFTDVSGKLFGQQEGSLSALTSLTEAYNITPGSSAVVVINDVEIERNSNSFTVDGVSLTLLSETAESSTITVTQDTDQIYDTVIKFLSEYNELVNSINKLLDAEPTYKNYLPLTAAQESEMSESQIEKWEERAREGLLRNDSALSGVLSSLRRTLYTKPEGSLALYDLGISTSYFGTKDNLSVSDPSKLKALIAENPNAVMALFTDTETGLATLLNNTISDATRSSTVNPGSLVRIAGAAGRPDTSSNIYRQIKDIKDGLGRLETRYEKEYGRYWKQFNAMESMISNMNSTSSWLASMMNSSW